MAALAKFYLAIIKIAMVLGFMGVLKEAILDMAGRALRAQRGMISYSKFTRALTGHTAALPKNRALQNH